MTILMRALFTAAGLFVLVAVLGLIVAVWTGDSRFSWSALIVFVAAVAAVFAGAGVASSIDKRDADLRNLR